eukprot:3549859-Rhodomonas_salina.1
MASHALTDHEVQALFNRLIEIRKSNDPVRCDWFISELTRGLEWELMGRVSKTKQLLTLKFLGALRTHVEDLLRQCSKEKSAQKTEGDNKSAQNTADAKTLKPL